ncbi:MAG: hypothetical protein HOC77_04940 [Chloroflexi bacterium]|nr:hypothetical protein [Chloroflexota bacterium]MBT4514424.1 hypothetical protein [Chloroflexota bacterium]
MSSKFFKRIAAPGLLGLALLAALLFATIGVIQTHRLTMVSVGLIVQLLHRKRTTAIS